jgi:hypothetical protein
MRILLASILVLGCSSDPSTSSTGTDAGADTATTTTDSGTASPDVGTTDSDPFGSGCNKVLNKGSTVMQTAGTTAPTITGGTWQIVAAIGAITARSNFDVTASGTTITLKATCPASSGSQTSPYTATATTLISGKADGSEVVTFEKL